LFSGIVITSCDPDWETVLETPEVCREPARRTTPADPDLLVPRIAILGVPIDNVTMPQAVARIEDMIASRQPHYVATANVDFLVQALHDVELRRVLVDADLVLCDGTPLVWASRWLGNPLPARVAGADLVPRLVQQAAEKHHRIFFLGGAPEVVARAVINLQNQYPCLDIAGAYSPPFAPLLEMDHEEIVRRIRAARPDLLFVSFGCPKAEKWMAMHYRSLGVPVAIGVGGTIDFLAGRLKRAPAWMQRSGTEWIWRLLQEPRRLSRRYGKDFWFFTSAILRQWWRMQLRPHRRAQTSHSSTVIVEPTWQRVRAPECLDAAAVQRDRALWETEPPRHWLLELEPVRFIDSTGVGLLVGLQKKLQVTGHKLILLAPRRAVLRVLRLMRLHDFFVFAVDATEAQRLIRDGGEEPEAPNAGTWPVTQPLQWQGEVTAANADRVWRQTQSQICAAETQQSPLVIDLSAVRFMDCSGLGVMVRAKKFAAERRVALRFASAHPNVQNVLRWARLESSLLEGAP
jgi:N-acetylglucosaminyldiphosphoundecaprenol N-acetyl-beta-D-mannosaminyltransferase